MSNVKLPEINNTVDQAASKTGGAANSSFIAGSDAPERQRGASQGAPVRTQSYNSQRINDKSVMVAKKERKE